MARSVNDYLPRNWRLMTGAGVAALGLACGLGQPALAHWWKLSKSDKAATAKATPPENGFAGAIRKLTAESRRAAEQGDHAKAVQLAERAAKISEAAAQVSGPAGDVSPQATAQYLADLRAGRQMTTSIASASPAQRSQPVAPPVGTTRVAAKPTAPPAVAKAQPAAPASPVAAAKPSAVTRVGAVASNAPRTVQPATATTAKAPLPPSPANEPANDLLAQSRLAAANGQLDRAIDLAEQAVDSSMSGSLFGPATRSSTTTDAEHWHNYLLSQKRQQPSTQEELDRPVQVASNPSRSRPELAEPEPASKFPDPLPASRPSAEVAASPAGADDSLWMDDLPPAPAPQPKTRREPIKFSRAVISRAGWVNADEIEAELPAPDLRAAEDTVPTDSVATPVESTEVIPEFPIDKSTIREVAETEELPSQPVEPEPEFEQTIVPAIDRTMEDDETKPANPTESPVRPALRLRGGIQLIAAEVPAIEPTAKKTEPAAVADAPVSTQTPEKTAVKPDQPEASARPTVNALKATDEVFSEGGDIPVQRFPIQRVIQLRQRLETAAALNPGSPSTANPADKSSATPSVPATNAKSAVAEWELDTKSATPSEKAVEAPAEKAAPAKRGPVKLRERTRLQLEEPADITSRNSSAVPKAPQARQATVGHSEMNGWKSASAETTSSAKITGPTVVSTKMTPPADRMAEQPKLSPPVSQVGFEVPASDDLACARTSTESSVPDIAPPPPSEEVPWYHDDARKERKSSTVHKSSFATIDRLADALKIPVSTMVSAIGGGGLFLIGVSLIAVRAAVRRRHSA